MLKLIALAVAALPLLFAGPAFSQESTTTGSAVMVKSAAAALSGAYGALDAATSVTIVRFSNMANANARTESIFGEGEDPDLIALRMVVAGNVMAVAALTAEGLTAQQVVAMKATGDGAVELYVNDLT